MLLSAALTALALAGGVLVTSGAATAVTVITTYPVAVSCASSGQTCDQAYERTVTTAGADLALEFQSAFNSCASFSVEFSVDGAPVYSSPLLGPFTTTGTVHVGLLSAGSHAIEVRATGTPGGCDDGTLHSWSGLFTLTTTDPVAVSPPPPAAPTSETQCKNGGWLVFTQMAFTNQGQCVSFVQRAARAGSPSVR